MNIAVFLYYFISVIYAPFTYIIPNIHNIPKRRLLLGILSTMVVTAVFVFFISGMSTYFICVACTAVLCLISINKISSVIFAFAVYACQIVTDYALIVFFCKLFSISEFQIVNDAKYAIPFYIILTICVLSISFLFSSLHFKFLQTALASDKKAIISIGIFVFICLVLFLFNIKYEAKKHFPDALVRYNSIIFFVFFSVATIFIIIFLRMLLQIEHLKYQNLQYEQLQEYTRKTEELYNEIRTFKHEYLNKLLTLHFYISDGDIPRLKDYYESSVLPTKRQLENDFQAFADLGNITAPELKGLVYNKLIRAQESGAQVHIEIKEKTKIPSAEEITELTGIYLDNAIDEILTVPKQQPKDITVAIYRDANLLTVLVSNTLASPFPPLDKIDSVGFSTRGTGRGMGLHIAKNILKRNPHIEHYTYIKDGTFYQELKINQDDKEA